MILKKYKSSYRLELQNFLRIISCGLFLCGMYHTVWLTNLAIFSCGKNKKLKFD